MSLTQRLTNIGRNALYAGATLTALIATQPGCQPAYTPQAQPQNYSQKTNQIKPKHTLEDFKQILGQKRLEGITKEENEEIEKLWNSDKEDNIIFRRLVYDVYSGKPVKELTLPEKYNKGYESFNPDSISQEKLENLKKRVPWKIIKTNGKYDEADKKMLFVLSKIEDGIDEAAAKWFAKVLVDYAIKPMIEAEKDKNKK